VTYDGLDERGIAALLGLPVVLQQSVPSVLDVAHDLGASGAPSGTLVLADEQTAGRGRQGRSWHSQPGAGVWMAMLLRPAAPPEGGALAVRAGLAVLAALAAAAPELAPRLKWPNDVMVGGRKAGGILCEARWSAERLGWVAIGIGLNVRGPVPRQVAEQAIALADVAPALSRLAVLEALATRVAGLAARPPALDEAERAAFWAARWSGADSDAVGIDADGALLVRTAAGSLDRRIAPS
jgi:BirA family biotin operon repressor/biotin-[acetyl-CoA-carboxylase] ligase